MTNEKSTGCYLGPERPNHAGHLRHREPGRQGDVLLHTLSQDNNATARPLEARSDGAEDVGARGDDGLEGWVGTGRRGGGERVEEGATRGGADRRRRDGERGGFGDEESLLELGNDLIAEFG